MFIYGYRLIKIDKEITTNTDRIMYLISMFSVLMEVIYYLILGMLIIIYIIKMMMHY